MSQLGQLKGQINQLANESKKTAGSLAAYKSKFSTQVSQVTATIGGSAQRVDQDMIQTLQTAEKQLDAAVAALQQAATAANRYASSL